MTTPKGGRPVIDGTDWFHGMEKRVGHEERRPRVGSAKDLLGPGFDAHAVQLLDWNSETARFNGMWFSVDALNAPTATGMFLGLTLSAIEGHIVQIAVTHATGSQVWLRRIHLHEAAAPLYEAWEPLSQAVPPSVVVFLPTAAVTPTGWVSAPTITAPAGLRAISKS